MEAFPMTRIYRVLGFWTAAVATILTLSNLLIAQRADLGVITGIVTDQTGSAIAGANVKVRNEGTGVETVLTTNGAGAYTTPSLVLGTYSITVDHPGFKTAQASGVQILGAQTIRTDISLAVGSTTESVEVTAGAETINSTTPDVSHTVDQKYYNDLPVITAADVRLPESMLQLQPGYLPMKPNGDPMFRGSQFNSRINGGQTMATENFFDGAAFGYASGHQQSHESSPPEDAIQEMKVITTTYSAQYGHTSGGFIEYTSKSGTNNVHGTAYEYFANDALNARGFFDADCDPATGQCTSRKKTPLKNNGFGFTAGGPVVIPKVYNGRNKTFFFTNIEWTRVREGVLPGFGNTTPLDAFRGCITDPVNGVCDFSAVQTQIYNPFSSGFPGTGRAPFMCDNAGNPIAPNANGTQAAGVACNKIPTALISSAAAQIASRMVSPDRAGPGDGVGFNVAGNPAGDQTWVMNSRNVEFRVDHNFTPNFRMTESFYWNHRPTIRNCGEVAGCNVPNNGATDPQANTGYYGNGFYQRIVTHHAHTQFEWIIRNNMSNHTTIAWDRWFMGGNPLSAGAGWPNILWGNTPGANQPQGVGGIVAQDAGPPEIDFTGDTSIAGRTGEYNSIGDYGWGKFGFETNNRWQFADDLTWVKGKHTIKVGAEYRWHQFNHSGWAVGGFGGQFRFDTSGTAALNGSNPVAGTGEAFASMLLGQVFSTSQTLPFYPSFYEGYVSPWINDEFKVNNKLTLTLGLRWDYQRARTEAQNRYSTFDPSTPNPGAGGLPGAVIFAGNCSGCSGRDTFEDPNHNAFGPRFGFAYLLNDKTVVRGGYGMYYSGISFAQFEGDPVMGYTSNPTVNNTSNGQFPAIPNAVNCTPNLASGCQPSPAAGVLNGFDYGFPTVNRTCTGTNPPGGCVLQPPFIDPTIANGTSPLAVDRTNGLTLPRYQNWSLTFERELSRNMRLDVSYIANKGTRLTAPWQAMGVAANMNDPSILSQYAPHILGLDINDPSVALAGIVAPYTPCTAVITTNCFSGTAAQALRSFPQYQNIIWRDEPLGASMYNALEVVVEQRVTRGLQFRVGYTYSKLHNDGSETGQSGDGRNQRIQNPACTHTCEWGLSDDDTPNVLLFAYTWEIPGAKHWHGAANALLGGWNLSGVLRYESGRPLNITMDNHVFDPTCNNNAGCNVGLGNILFNPQKRPDRVKGSSAIAKQVGSYYNPLIQNYFNTAGWTDTGTNPFGNAPRADGTARGFPTYNEDMTVFKNFVLKEPLTMKFEAQFGNIFNRTDFCNPSTFWSPGPATFGSVNTQCNYPRSIQFGLKFSY
jgi:Carboxypeptidase regulatory-like domain/TonB dependent receptor